MPQWWDRRLGRSRRASNCAPNPKAPYARVWGLGDGMLADPAGAGDGGRRDLDQAIDLGRTLAQHRYHRRALPQRDQRVDRRGVQLRPHPRPAGVHPSPANQRDGRALTIRRPSDQRLHELTGRTLYLRGLGAQGEQNTGAHQRPGAHSSPRALWVSPRHPAAPRGQNPQRCRVQPENDLHQARWALDEVTLGRKDSPGAPSAPHRSTAGPDENKPRRGLDRLRGGNLEGQAPYVAGAPSHGAAGCGLQREGDNTRRPLPLPLTEVQIWRVTRQLR